MPFKENIFSFALLNDDKTRTTATIAITNHNRQSNKIRSYKFKLRQSYFVVVVFHHFADDVLNSLIYCFCFSLSVSYLVGFFSFRFFLTILTQC